MKSVTSRFAFVLAIALWGGLLLPDAFSVTNLYNTFESDTNGMPPSGWTITGAMTGVVTNDIARSSSQSLLLTHTQYPSSSIARTDLSPTISTSTNAWVDVRFSVNFAQGDGQYNFWLTDSSHAPYINFTFGSGGIIFATTNLNGSIVIFTPYYSTATNTWYDVNLQFNPSQDLFNFHVKTNDTPVVTAMNLPVYNPSLLNISYFEINSFGSESKPANTMMHIDNIIIEVPEPNCILLVGLAAGGFFLLHRRRTAIGRREEAIPS